MNPEQLTQLIDRYQRPLLSVIYKLVHSWEAAKDIVQEAFLRLWEKYGQLEHESRLFNLLYRIAINLSIDHIRKIKDDDYDIRRLVAGTENYSEDAREFFDILIHCAAELKPKQKAAFVLRDIEGFDFSEISEILDTPVENVRSNLSLARKNIKQLLETRYSITEEFFNEL